MTFSKCFQRPWCRYYLLIAFSALISFSPPLLAGERASGVRERNYTWAGQRIAGNILSLATARLKAGEADFLLLLTDKEILIGRLGGKGFEKIASCVLPGTVQGARIYSFDLDGDGIEEIIVSAVDDGIPASFALSYSDGRCRTLFERERHSLRVIGEGEKNLIGQGWSSGSFFSGPIVELSFASGKLKESARLRLPKGTGLFQFSLLPGGEGIDRVALLKGSAPLEIFEGEGGHFKRVWKSGQREGGAPTLLPARQRSVMGAVTSDSAAFDLPPVIFSSGPGLLVIAPRSDLTLKGVIGRKPIISGSWIDAFKPDEAFILANAWQTVRLPGTIADYLTLEPAAGAEKELLLLMQNDAGMFQTPVSATLMRFDLRE